MVVLGDDGIIMVDAEFAPMHDKIKAAVAAISKEPIKYIVNTHFHPDHSSGDALFIKEGVTVVAQENVKKWMLDGSTNGLTGAKTAGLPADAVPTCRPIKAAPSRCMCADAALERRAYPEHAHTDGDSYVYFPGLNILATGDIVTLGRYPNSDFANGGSIKGMIAGVDYLSEALQRQDHHRSQPWPDRTSRRSGRLSQIP